MHHVFYFKILLANVALVASLLLIFVRWPFLERRPHLAIIGYYAIRVAILALIFLKFKFGYPAENMGMYYYYAGIVLHGAVPDRDFYMLYGILFPYLLAGPIYLWHHRFALILLFQLMEFGSVYALFTQKNCLFTVRDFLGYALNPITLVWVWLGLSNQSMCLVPTAVLFAVRNEAPRSLLFALGFAISKIFSLWTIIPALAFQRVRSMVIFALGVALIYGPFLLAGSQGISFKATESDGSLTDDANGGGIQSLIGLIPSATMRLHVGHDTLLLTGGLLLVVMVSTLVFRYRIGEGNLDKPQVAAQRLAHISIFAVLLTLIYQAFSPYTAPDYLITAIVLVPVLVKAGFWSNADQVVFLIVTFLQAVVYLVWFHFPEFSDKDAHGNWVFLTFLIACNIFTVGCCLACAWKSFVFLRRELRRFSAAEIRQESPVR